MVFLFIISILIHSCLRLNAAVEAAKKKSMEVNVIGDDKDNMRRMEEEKRIKEMERVSDSSME